MNIFSALKHSVLLAIVIAAMTGCAAAPTQEEEQGANAEQAQAAIEQARGALSEAQAEGAAWRDTADLIAQAEEAANAGDTARAYELAQQAQRQAENALAQKQAEEARLAEQQAAQQAAEATTQTYTVSRGDTLWGISGKETVYGNPYQWPLIFKANRDQIRDADLIYPGQQFVIKHDWSSAEVDAAVNHARTRGAWSLGTVEESDMMYLSR